MPPALSAVIFDFDGTLVDTMPFHFRAYRDVLVDYGVDLTRVHFDAVVGGKASETIPRMAGRSLSAETVAEIHRRKKERVGILFGEEPVVRLQTSWLLELFRGRLPLGLASAGSRAGIMLILRQLGWEGAFGAVVTGEDVTHGKPAPDAFLLAAQVLRASPPECLVFEDTDAGIAAACAAGMRSIDVRLPLNQALSI